jgi:hypothetical protein
MRCCAATSPYIAQVLPQIGAKRCTRPNGIERCLERTLDPGEGRPRSVIGEREM